MNAVAEETALTAASLYERDPGFRSFMALWDENRRPDGPLIDYLLDRGMERQAACVRWCYGRPDSEVFDPIESYGERAGECGPFPGCFGRKIWRFSSVEIHPKQVSAWRPHWIPFRSMIGGEYEVEAKTPTEAILALMDAWKEPL